MHQQNVYDLIQEFLKQYPEATYGSAHIVLDDYNLEDFHILWSLEHLKKRTYDKHHSNEEVEATIAFLKKLLEIPENERCLSDEDNEDCWDDEEDIGISE